MNERDTTELIDYLEDRLPADWRRTLEADAEFRARLTRLAGIRTALAELPDPEPPPFTPLSETPPRRRRPRWLHGPASGRLSLATVAVAATAAAAAVVAVVGIGLWQAPDNGGGVSIEPVAGLMAESQTLERVWAADRPYRLVAGPVTRGIAMRIADVDGEIAALGEPTAEDMELRRVLWQRRVELMQSLIDNERARPEPPFVL